MHSPTLRILSGPDAGREIELNADEVILGRGSKADVTIADRLLSRHHARLFRALDGWYVEDMRSTNGTWMAGQSIRMPTQIEPGQRVRIGKTVFEVVTPDTASRDPDAMSETMISYRLDPGAVESLTIMSEGGTRVQREQDKLAAIYEVQGLLGAGIEDRVLYARILEVITRVLPSDICFLLLYRPEDESLEPVASENRLAEDVTDPESFISRSIINYVKEHHQAVLSSEVTDESRINQTYVSGMNMTSIMCVPLLAHAHLSGMIYLLSLEGAQIFQQDDLRLLSAIAQSAALALENSRLVARNIQNERMAAVGMTAAGLSHYVKNILSGLEGSISLLRLGMDSDNHDTMDAAWNILNTNHRRLSSLMLDLLSLSKELKLTFEDHNVADIVMEVVQLVQSQVQNDKITVELNPEARDSQLWGRVDNRGIHRTLLNLLNNAVDSVRQQHGDSGEGRIDVDAWLENEGETLVMEVKDNGVGIPEDELDRIFESFHTTKGDRGTGLGLAVSKRIVDGHRGRIQVSCTADGITAFTVKIPTRVTAAATQYIQRSTILKRKIVAD